MMPTIIYNAYDVIVVPFPFTDKSTAKRRPALIMSANKFNANTGNVICAMITTAKHTSWESDIEITDLDQAGLCVDSFIRFKLFTIDQVLIIRKIGVLGKKDQKIVSKNVSRFLL